MNKSVITIAVVVVASLLGGWYFANPPFGADIQINDTAVADKVISYTDENVGEGFIIKSDSKDYYGFGGNSLIYFSVTNISKDNQTANIVYSLGGSSVFNTKRFNRNETTERFIPEITSATSTEKARTVTETNTIWDDIYLESPKINLALSRKSIGDKVSKNGFTDTFKSGETKYYQAEVRIPNNDELFVEAFGSKLAYGHLDPNLWTYEQKFNDLNDGNLPGQDSWANIYTTQPQVDTTGTPYEGTKHVSHTFGSRGGAGRTIDAIVSGTVYFSMKKTVVSPMIFSVKLQDPSHLNMEIDLQPNGVIGILNSTGNNTDSGFTHSANTYVRIGLAFEYGAGAWEGLSAKTYKINVNNGNWSAAVAMWDSAASSNTTKITTDAQEGTAGQIGYIDFISPNYAAAAVTAPIVAEDGYVIEEE